VTESRTPSFVVPKNTWCWQRLVTLQLNPVSDDRVGEEEEEERNNELVPGFHSILGEHLQSHLKSHQPADSVQLLEVVSGVIGENVNIKGWLVVGEFKAEQHFEPLSKRRDLVGVLFGPFGVLQQGYELFPGLIVFWFVLISFVTLNFRLLKKQKNKKKNSLLPSKLGTRRGVQN